MDDREKDTLELEFQKIIERESKREEVNREIERLKALDVIDYELVREEMANKLGFRVSVLDEVTQHQLNGKEHKILAGSPISFEDEAITPYAGEVRLSDLLNEIRRVFNSYLVLPSEADIALSLWTVLTYVFDQFGIVPYIALSSAQKRSGKSRVIEVMEKLAYRTFLTSNTTTPVIFRVVDAYHPTLLIDEADSFARGEEFRNVLNMGDKKGGKASRCIGEDNEVRVFDVFGPKLIAGIGSLPDTVRDRCVIIRMKRKRHDEGNLKKFSYRLKFDELQSKCKKWAEISVEELGKHEPETPPKLIECNDRAAEAWGPLLAIAEFASKDWAKKARKAAVHLSGDGVVDEETVLVELLKDIKKIFDDIDGDVVPSNQIVNALNSYRDKRWCEWNRGEPMSPRQLAQLLKPLDLPTPLEPKLHRVGLDVFRGYEKKDFEDAFSRYL